MGYLSISSHEIPGFHVCDLPFPTPWTLPIPCVSPPGAVPCPPGTSFLSPGSEPHFLYFSAFRSPVVRPRTHSWCLPFAAFLSMVHFSARLFCIGFFCLFFRIFYLFLDRGRHQCAAASHAPLTGDLASTQACALTRTQNQGPFDSQAGTQLLSHTSRGYIGFFSVTLANKIIWVSGACTFG